MQKVNQLHPPRKKYPNEIDEGENRKRKIFYKDGNSSMLFCKGATNAAAKVLISSLRENAKKLGVELEGNFIIIQQQNLSYLGLRIVYNYQNQKNAKSKRKQHRSRLLDWSYNDCIVSILYYKMFII